MKLRRSVLFPLLTCGLLAASAVSSKAALLSFYLDFDTTDGNNQLTAGYQSLAFGASLNTTAATSFNIGSGVTLSFTNIGCYNTGNATQPLTTDGFYNTGNGVNSTFTLSGLTPGSTVTLYATDAWDGAGRAAYVSLGGGAYADTATGNQNPGSSTNSNDFTLVAQDVAAPTGTLTGMFGPTNGTDSRGAEAQIGAFIIQVNTPASVPEPSSIALSALGLTGLASWVLRRRRRGQSLV